MHTGIKKVHRSAAKASFILLVASLALASQRAYLARGHINMLGGSNES